MAMMLGALYRALVAAKVTEEDAQKAAEEVAAYESRLATIETKLTVLQWMVGFLTALSLGQLWLLVNLLGRVGPR
jgi:hypothetical protein